MCGGPAAPHGAGSRPLERRHRPCSAPNMPDRLAAAATLRAELVPIMDEWERRVREALPEANRVGSTALVDSMPDILERIAETMESGAERAAERYKALAAKHARERAESGVFAVEHVIAEYHLLTQVLLDTLERDEPLDRGARDMLRGAIETCVSEASTEFTSACTRELTRDRTLYQHLVQSVPDYAIVSIDPSGRVTTWNEGAARMNGYRPDEIIGRHFSVLYPEDARQRNEATQHLEMAQSRGRYRGEGWRVRKSGELFLADVLMTPIYVRGRLEGYSKIVADLTERSKIIQEREMSRAELADIRAEQRAREDFISKLSHDLRSPLSAAQMGAELMRRELDEHSTLDGLMQRVVRNLTRMDEMIQKLLDASRLRAGEIPAIERVPCELSAVVRETLDELTTVHGDRFVLHAPARVEGQWDPSAVRRIVENLASNAVKYGSPTEPITITLVKTSREVQVSVHNHGHAISPEERQHVFDSFSRAIDPERASAKGWGIGLAVVKGLTEAHGGRVRVDSAEGAGTTFKVDLPLRPADAASARTLESPTVPGR